MNSDTLEGQGTNVAGQIKEAVGKATGDEQLAGEGVADQWAGIAQNGFGKLRDFARERPFAAGLLGVVVGLAFFNTLRGKR
ncbi:uncharacterized protein YjbJ (UPF0337 family) [Sphingomonas vulcanisoli]|uniref:Uncharacterized protein YjbJ (UPF0337 family) n=1 Tax=Sphingomonas vulcanisoli TaxID=1658060 RepID=A0ABX0TVU2_9SPHN|nr:CsbD family protein [Sphingomonas vulcanisoli]NIJ08490.1 uncharacterized protein YjbJ (UPF0337 family) [Sphingomonas vulcanisoli]